MDNPTTISDSSPTASRKDMQYPRRIFHMSMGITVATIYYLFLGQTTAIYILGAVGSFLYLLDQIRINYPEIADKTAWVNQYLLRAEEKLKESSAIPYSMGLILTIFTFPKSVAVSAIYTLAIADPLSALIGIKYGKHRIVPHKSLEGSAAFFFGTFFSVIIVFLPLNYSVPGMVLGMALFTSIFTTSFEMVPDRKSVV